MSNENLICEASVKKIVATVRHGLSYGIGEPTPGKMCVEAAVCYGLGLPHSDDPGCVHRAVRDLKIRLNDTNRWSGDGARAKGLLRLAVAQLGTKNTLNGSEFSCRVVQLLVNTTIASLPGLPPEVVKRCQEAVTMGECRTATTTAANAYYAAANAAAAAAATNAVSAAANAAAYAAYAANAAYAAAADKVLSDFAEGVVQILIDMKSPGAQYLFLTE